MARVARIVLVGLTLGACTPLVDYRGNLPTPQSLASINPGVSTKADVSSSLGSPSAVATFDPNIWYYISKHTESVAFWSPETLDQKVVQISFDQNGRVESVKQYAQDDGEDVPIEKAKTPTAGQSLTIIQQFFGNLGRFVGDKAGASGK
jgi:outer membrane protein assembly factor BamE (lipoprotein component of BamABCDE complex)